MSDSGQTPGAAALALLLLVVAAWMYWPGIHGPELLDDRSSVLVIDDLQDRPERAMDYIFGDGSGLLGRSVSMTSFVLERLYLGEELIHSKRVNILLHLANGTLVIWLFWLLFRFMAIPGYAWLAVLSGGAWLFHPLFISTVLYVVQRMAMLTTFFMLLSTIAYVYWRLALISGRLAPLRLLLVPLFLLLALFSKENAIVLLPILLLLEVFWFRWQGAGGLAVSWLRWTSLGAIAAGAVGLSAVLLFRYDWLAARFVRRPFTLEERLLTEARIVWDYLGQLAWPDTVRMGIYHDDVVVSTSPTEPLITLYALLAWGGVLLFSAVLLRWRWGRYLLMGWAWFLLGHAVESTVLPLELYFEHRNYFPAVGLALMLGTGVGLLVSRLPAARGALYAWLAVVPLLFSLQASSQVQIWSSRPLLILNHLNGHPDSMRANIDMATELARLGDIEAALVYSAKAYEVSNTERAGDREVRDIALACIAAAPIPASQIDALGRSDPERPLSSVTTLLTMVRMVESDACPGIDREYFADRLAQIFLVEDYRRRGSANIYSNLAVLENALQRWDRAYAYVERFLALSPGNKRGLLMKLHFATALGKVTEVDAVIGQLESLDERGELTVGERQTLDLYLE